MTECKQSAEPLNIGHGICLSLIIPTYNCEDYLDETLSSVLPDLPKNCELIIVDDGSDDATVSMLQQYEQGGARMKVSYEKHAGASNARNKGLSLANGKYVSFMDCDDCQCDGFFEKSLPLTDSDADLYVFGFLRVEHAGAGADQEETQHLLLNDKTYDSVSDFADEYIRGSRFLLYSGCNKFYKRSILDTHAIRYREGLVFGEDRLFNYDYLRNCRTVVTSSITKFQYMQRNENSLSKRSYRGFLETLMMLHRAKIDCLFSLSTGTSEAEKRGFAGRDLQNEVASVIERFEKYPQERDESLEQIHKLLYAAPNMTVKEMPENWYQDAAAVQTVLDEIYKRGCEKRYDF